MKIELLTPVHIGTGEEIPLYEWKVQDNCWLRFDWFTLPDRLLPPDDVLQDVDKLTKAAKDLSWEEGFKNKMYTLHVNNKDCIMLTQLYYEYQFVEGDEVRIIKKKDGTFELTVNPTASM